MSRVGSGESRHHCASRAISPNIFYNDQSLIEFEHLRRTVSTRDSAKLTDAREGQGEAPAVSYPLESLTRVIGTLTFDTLIDGV
jgi:hypothetical protein